MAFYDVVFLPSELVFPPHFSKGMLPVSGFAL